MSAAERRELSRAAIECSFSSGEHVVRRGEESDAMFVVVEGACAVVLPNGDRIPLGPGAHFGEIALVTGERRTADVVADSERTNLLRLPKASVEPVLARRPEFQTRVAAIARERREATLGAGAAPSNREEGSGFIRALLRLIRPF
jgi:CRP-like cAMP-binding protein